MNQPSLFTITLAAPVTITFKPPTTPGDHYQRPPLTLTQLAVAVRDDGSTVSAEFVGVPVPRLKLWSATTTPPYSSTPPGTGAGDTWTNATVQSRAQQLIGGDAPTQLAAIRALFPSNQIV
jgi:hypothetical protein